MYKNEKTYEERCEESRLMLTRFSDRIPVIVERKKLETPCIDKRKFMAPKTLTIGQLIFVVRRRLRIQPEQAIFLFVKNSLVVQHMTIEDVYERYKDDDGFVYISYDFETTFGESP